jgi:N-acylneuraminate cytidylyltransferase
MEEGLYGDDDSGDRGATVVKKRFLAIVPARSGSKSIKDKNLQKVQGHSLIGWAVHAASQLRDVTVYLDTDSRTYAEEGRRYGAEVPFLRRKHFSGDKTSDTETFGEFISRLDIDEGAVLIHVRPTTPLRRTLVLKKALTQFDKNIDRATSLRSVHEMAESAYKSFELGEGGFLGPIKGLVGSSEAANLPRQAFPATFVANGYIDVFPASNIRRFGSLHGPKILGFVTEVTPEIDSSHELQLVRLLSGNESFQKDVHLMTKGLLDV